MDIQNAAAIVTGGGSGLGAATARMLAAAGAKVAIFDISETNGQKVANEVDGKFFRTDITQESSIVAAMDAAGETFGTARLLVNCAGVTPLAKIVQPSGDAHPLKELMVAIEVNLIGTFVTLSHFAARLARIEPIGEERGVAINTASIAAYEASSGLAAYAASKGAVASFTLPAARDLASHQIRVVSIAPGMFYTPMVGNLSDEENSALGASVPFPNRMGRPEEFARLVASIIDNPMLNGSVLRLDAAHRLPA